MADENGGVLQRLEELERRVSQMVVRGQIVAVDTVDQRARVAYGPNLVTGWLPWKPIRTGAAIVWWAPEVGEGVTVISEGDLSLGEILPGSYHNTFPAPSSDPDLFLVQFGDGGLISYHRGTGRMDINTLGELNVTVGGRLTMAAYDDIRITSQGNVAIQGARIDLN